MLAGWTEAEILFLGIGLGVGGVILTLSILFFLASRERRRDDGEGFLGLLLDSLLLWWIFWDD